MEKQKSWEEYIKVFPEKLIKARTDAGLSQKKLANLCDLTGQTIWIMERRITKKGESYRGPRKSNILKIFRVLPKLEADFKENYGYERKSD
jgi:DNA-binding XRE family transcriptional regulator